VDADALLVPMLHWPQAKSEPNKREEYPGRKKAPPEEGRRALKLNWEEDAARRKPKSSPAAPPDF
jgi:hypothetical protein